MEIIEAPIIGGPDKGKMHTFRKGCKCEDNKLAVETLEAKERIKKRKILEVFDRFSLVPPALRDATIKMYSPKNESQEAAKQAAIQFVQDFDPDVPKNMLMFGPYGVGKSHLARCMSRGAITKGYSSIFIPVPKLLRKLRGTYDDNSEFTEDQLVTALETVDLLIMDDIGAESDSKYAKDRVFDIVDSRQGKSTIYTSNLTPEQLLDRDERNFSRVLNADTDPLEILGDNHRLRNFI